MTTGMRRIGLSVFLGSQLFAAVDFSDTTIYPAKGKQGQSFAVAFSSANCMAQSDKGTNNLKMAESTILGGNADLTMEGSAGGEDCIRKGTLKIHDDADPGEMKILFKPAGAKTTEAPGSPAILISFTIVDKNVGPIPPGLKPTVDIQWDVLDKKIARDNFGKRVAENFYVIQVVIGNDSGYALQLASVGFIPRSVSALAFAQQVLPNSSYVTARGVLEEGQILSARNTADRFLQGTAILLAGFTPFFKNVGHRSTYAAAVAVFANPLLQSFEKILPDKTITELKRLDDFTLRDGVVVANNTHVRTIVLFQKYLVQGMVALTKQQLKTGLEEGAGNLRSLIAILDELQKNTQSAVIKTRAEQARQAAQRAAATQDPQALGEFQAELDDLLKTLSIDNSKLSSTEVLELQIGNLRLLRFIGAGIKNVDELMDALIVRWELSRIVLVGDEIAYINRVRVDSAAPTIGVPAPLIVDETDPKGIPPGKKTMITVTGQHLEGAVAATKDISGNIKVEKGTTDVNGKYLTVAVTVDPKFVGSSFDLLISSPGIGGTSTVHVGVVAVVRKITPDTLPQSGGDVKVEGERLKDVFVYLDDPAKPLPVKNADANSFTVTIPRQSKSEVTLNFTPDTTVVETPRKLTLAVPIVQSISPTSLSKSGGDVKIVGQHLTGVQAFVNAEIAPLPPKNAGPDSFTVTIPAEKSDEITLNFKASDGSLVKDPQKLKMTK